MTNEFISKLLSPYAGMGLWGLTMLLMMGWISTEQMSAVVNDKVVSQVNQNAMATTLELKVEYDRPDVGEASLLVNKLIGVPCDSTLENMVGMMKFSPVNHQGTYSLASSGRNAGSIPSMRGRHCLNEEDLPSRRHAAALRTVFRGGTLVCFCATGLWCLVFAKSIYNPLNDIMRKLDSVRDVMTLTRSASQVRNPVSEVEWLSAVLTDTLRAIEVLGLEGTGRSVVLPADNPFSPAVMALQKKMLDTQNQFTASGNSLVKIEDLLKAENHQDTLHARLLSVIVPHVNARSGALYGFNDTPEEQHFYLLAGHAIEKTARKIVPLGDGLLGEVGAQKKLVVSENIPPGYLTIQSGLGQAQATSLVIVPLLFKDQLYGAIELGFFSPVTEANIAWLQRVGESIAAHFFNRKMQETTQRQLEEIARKQELELKQVRQLQEETYQKLELQFEEAQQERARSLAILEGCVDGVISFNQSGEILFSNSAIREMLDFSEAETERYNISTLLPVEVVKNEHNPHVVIAGTKKQITVRTEVSAKTSGGEGIDVLITSSQFTLQRQALFNFFVQKISVDLF